MGEDVSTESLADVVAGYGFAYLVTVTADGGPHAVATAPRVVGDAVVVDEVGSRSRTNATERPKVSLLYPPSDPDGHSLIVDGVASVADAGVTIAPTRAVRHRPHERPGGGVSASGCGSDCLPVDLPASAPSV
ncbi:MAG TPA: pyridoxamine 5'-phosphate oxidase family protein [Segeticoccus sp.]|uniref:pyridoxamine 5'-phosphate oxidase family protein n=1 Tax=Segeticoccus sp. TaxID=2706531 RepID=UPI002D809B5E|nr:pyridoxamine 5'-phosphate oxidase family protein [Segeticoccus sp.]HET8599387.1 pyridoxamine 5'-phosphate oxidase family protein [Segeticoccus sp.]